MHWVSVPVFALFNPMDPWEGQVHQVTGDAIRIMIHVLGQTSEPDLTAAWFKSQYAVTLRFGILLTLPIALVATLSALLRGGIKAVIQTYLIGLPISVLGGAVVIMMMTLFQSIDQNLTDTIASGVLKNFDDFYNRLDFGNNQVLQYDGISQVIHFALMVLMIFATLFLWLELIIRQMIIYMAVLFMPISLAVYVWAAARRWFYMLFELMTTMIFSKFVIMACLSMGFAAVLGSLPGGQATAGAGNAGASLQNLIMGTGVIMITAFATPALIAFVMMPSHQMTGRKDAMVTPYAVGNVDRVGAVQDAGRGIANAGKALGSALK